MALVTYAILTALLVVRQLKQGYDVDGDKKQLWCESFIFGTDPSYSILDRVPKPSVSGKRTLGYRYYVGAWVGFPDKYEYSASPLKIALLLFQKGIASDQEACYAWILPHLVIICGSYHGIENFPADDYEILLLQGAGGQEWRSPDVPCLWLDIESRIITAEQKNNNQFTARADLNKRMIILSVV